MEEHEPMVEHGPMMEHEPIVELEPMVEHEPMVEPESDPTPKLVPESALEEVKLLHDYLDPFLPPELGTPAFKSCCGELFPWWITNFLPTFSVARSAVVGLHHQLLKARLYHINSRMSFFPLGENDRNQIIGRINPIR